MYNNQILELSDLTDEELLDTYDKVEEHLKYLSDRIINQEEESDSNE